MPQVCPISECIDLHIHSTASDGSFSVSQIIEAAKSLGLRAISITDHDTLAGSLEALSHPQSPSLEILSGIELSADFPSGTMHILGYMIRVDDSAFLKMLERIQRARSERNLRIVKKLQALGIDVEYDEVIEASGGGQVGRPHFAQVLISRGVVQSAEEAFSKYLRKGRPGYANRYRLKPAEAIEAISQAGGVPVLAHPFTLEPASEGALEEIVVELKANGLKGIEVYCPDPNLDRRARYEKLVRLYGLLMTGGTDFHGAAKPDVHLGVGKGDLRIPYSLVENLKACQS